MPNRPDPTTPQTPGPADAPASRRALLAHARHELRTPLNAILGYSELLLEDMEELGTVQGPEFALDLQRVQRNGRQLLMLVDSLFDAERLVSPRGGALCDHAARISHTLRTPLTSVIGYCEMLLEDADDGPGTVRAELLRILGAGRQMLTVVEETVRMLEVDAPRSDPPVLPARTDAESEVRSAAARTPEPLTGARLLVVDDNETNLDLLGRRIRRYGHDVTTAQNGAEALRLVRAREFDIVLLDVIMPELDGYETLKSFKEDDALRDIPVIMISALDEMDSVARCIELGAEDYLPKTFDPILLQARIAACLEKKSFRDREKLYLKQIESEKRRADELLRVILPEPIIHELHTTNTVKPRRYDDVAVLFCDVVGFTTYCSERAPEAVIADLQEMIQHFEQIAVEHGVLKIKTVGDSFMGTVGLITVVENPVLACVECGLRMVEEAHKLASGWDVRVGIHAGPVVAGVVGRRQYLFDLWGDTVNTAARVERHGTDGAVNVSSQTWQRIHHAYGGASLGLQQIKGKGEIEIYRIHRLP